jgi:predicted ArsR family transcriptional regulator
MDGAVSTDSRPADPSTQESGRLRVLELLRSAPTALGVTDLAARLGLHPNTVRFHLNRLVGAGLVTREVEAHTGPGRPRLTFAAVAQHDLEGGRRNYQLLADMLAGFIAGTSPDAAGQAVEFGRTWGRYLATRPAPAKRVTEGEAVGELLRVLDDIGFSPVLAEGDDEPSHVLLRHCPFLEVASAHREVICSLHLGVMQGVLTEQRAPLEATQLRPFVEPSLCVADLSRLTPSSSGA